MAHTWHTESISRANLAQPSALPRAVTIPRNDGVRGSSTFRRGRLAMTSHHSSGVSDGVRRPASTPLAGILQAVSSATRWPRSSPTRSTMHSGTRVAHAVVLRDVPWIQTGCTGKAVLYRAADARPRRNATSSTRGNDCGRLLPNGESARTRLWKDRVLGLLALPALPRRHRAVAHEPRAILRDCGRLPGRGGRRRGPRLPRCLPLGRGGGPPSRASRWLVLPAVSVLLAAECGFDVSCLRNQRRRLRPAELPADCLALTSLMKACSDTHACFVWFAVTRRWIAATSRARR